MKNLLSGFLGGILGAVLIAGGFVYANNNHYVGFNPASGVNNIPGQWTDSVTAPQTITASGCTIGTQHGGTNVGQFIIASGGTCTITMTDVVVGDTTGILGYTCALVDTDAPSYLVAFKQTANTATGCTITGSASTGDHITYLMFGYGDQ